MSYVGAREFHNHSSDNLDTADGFRIHAFQQSLIIEIITFTVRVSAQAKYQTNKDQPTNPYYIF